MRIPTNDQLRSDAQFLGFSERDTQRLLTAAERARTGSSERDGFKTTHGASGSRVSGIGDPVGEAATEAPYRPSEVEKQHALLFSALEQAASAKRGVRNTLDRLGELQQWQRPVGKASVECCTAECDGEAVARGRCDACRKWQERNPYPDGTYREVPSEVIAERTRRRAKAS